MQGGEGEAALSEQLSECLCVCSRLALHASQRRAEECSKEVACLVNMILAAVQHSARIQKELASALKYKASAKQMMEDMRAVIEQQRQIIRTSQEKTQSSASLQVFPVTADVSTNTDDSYSKLVSENERLKRTVQELRGNMARLSAELHDSKVAREAQEKVLDMLYQEHQATITKCAKLENSLKTMKAAVQQVLAPQHKRHHTRYHEGHDDDDDFDSRSSSRTSSRRHDKPSPRSSNRQYTLPWQENFELEAEVAERRNDREEKQSREPETREEDGHRGRAQEEPIDEQSPLVQMPALRSVAGIALVETRPTLRYSDNDEDEDEDKEEEPSALAEVVLPSSHDIDQEPEANDDEDVDEDGDHPSQERSHCSDESLLQEEDSLGGELEEDDACLDEDEDDQHDHESERDAEDGDDDDEILAARSGEDESDDGVELVLSPPHREDHEDQLDDVSSSQDRPNDSIAQMQRFYSSLLIDDMLP